MQFRAEAQCSMRDNLTWSSLSVPYPSSPASSASHFAQLLPNNAPHMRAPNADRADFSNTITGWLLHNCVKNITLPHVYTSHSLCRLGHTNTIMCCRFDFSGMNLCTCSMDCSALVWDIRMWKKLLKLRYRSVV